MEDADLIILNTCHIRERSSEKVFSELGKIRELKEERAARGLTTQIAVAGCVAQAEGAEIFRRQKAVDLVVGSQSYHRLPELLARLGDGARVIETEFPTEDRFDFLPAPEAAKTRSRGVSAFLTVQEGCDKFCTFCVVPYTRGAEMSRPLAKILRDAEDLARNGVRELTLLGQNVNAFHGLDDEGQPVSLATLLDRLSAIPGIARLRYMTSHPNDMGDDLIAAHAHNPAVMPFLHLPVQSGSDRILDAMNRRHTRAHYLDLVRRIRNARPDVALSTDFIVGFPGESEADFEETLALAREVNFASTYFFKYSARPGTPGADLPHQVEEAVKTERLARLQTLVEAQRAAFNQSLVGKTVEILVEKPGRHAGQVTGRSPYLQPVHIAGGVDLIGSLQQVLITECSTNSLFGHVSGQAHSPHPEVIA